MLLRSSLKLRSAWSCLLNLSTYCRKCTMSFNGSHLIKWSLIKACYFWVIKFYCFWSSDQKQPTKSCRGDFVKIVTAANSNSEYLCHYFIWHSYIYSSLKDSRNSHIWNLNLLIYHIKFELLICTSIKLTTKALLVEWYT